MSQCLAPECFARWLPRSLTLAAEAAGAITLAACLHAGPAKADGGPAGQSPAASSLSREGSGPALHAQVQRLIGRAACDSDTQCRTLPLGTRACGGPESYLAWSVLGTDQAALQRAAGRYGQWKAQQQARSGTMSICMVETDPGAVCARPTATARPGSGRCVVGDAAVGGATR